MFDATAHTPRPVTKREQRCLHYGNKTATAVALPSMIDGFKNRSQRASSPRFDDHFCRCRVERKRGRIRRVVFWSAAALFTRRGLRDLSLV